MTPAALSPRSAGLSFAHLVRVRGRVGVRVGDGVTVGVRVWVRDWVRVGVRVRLRLRFELGPLARVPRHDTPFGAVGVPRVGQD